MPARSSTIRHAPGCAMKPETSSPCAAIAGASARCAMHALMPIAPSGTRPISTVRAESFSHNSEPTPTPIENTASANTYSVCVPPKWVSAYTGKLPVSTVPMNQNQLTPSTLLRTASCLRASRQMASDSGIGFHWIFSPGAAASTLGIARLARLPMMASTITANAAACGPFAPATVKINPPSSMPSRIAMDVPISTRPLPPVSSSGLSTEGRIEYFTGPNRADCMPVANNATSSTGMFCSMNPTAASDMMAISIAVVMRISFDFSLRSANCPAIEENKKYGRMNTAGASCV